MRAVLDAEPLARTDYVSVADPESFRELARAEGSALLSLAAFIGRARLIDNITVGAH
jgi:pantoate--beta-alanine ligase